MSDPTSAEATANRDRLAELADDYLRRHRAGERPSIDQYAQQHPELANEIRDLFPAMIAMEQPALGATLNPVPSAERVGATIGRYKLLERIGEGGFGVVYMAEQHHPVRRKVALKVVKPGMDSRQVLARFDAERQALAIMDHPNIAKVFDGGMTDSGRPYFVMELVKGEPITSYCDANQLPPRQRLELFVQVCDAVQHAHQKGIIHRDIKPTNVLVAVHDTTPVVKVIDFGVAKALGQELTEKTLFTGFAQLLGTPLYMSPEQAGQSAIDVDTRSDIYSLGVLLYELLTGTTPFDKERFRKAAQDEIRRIIREEDPPRPSTRLSGSKDSLASISAQRHTEPAKLTKLVRGELDWIVMKALEKDRSRRYETANGLARDVERYLHDEPVAACPPSATYRLRKVLRRYRVPLTVAAGFLLLLVIAAVVSTYQAIRIRAEQKNTLAQKLEADRHRADAERERDRAVAAERNALTEARKSEQVAAFMADMLKGVGPSVALGRDTAMLREILDKTTQRFDQLKGQPAVEADLRSVLGRVYFDLGDKRNAEAMYRGELPLRRELVGDKHADVARTLVDLANSLMRERSAEAERLFAEGLAMQRELLGNDPAVGLTLFRIGNLYNQTGRSVQAEPLFREAVAIYSQHPGQDVSLPLDQLALSLTYQSKFAEAEPIALECVALRRKQAPSGGDPALARSLFNLGQLYQRQGRHPEAIACFREALEIGRKQLPPGHDATSYYRGKLARSLFAVNRGEEAVLVIDEYLRFVKGRLREQFAPDFVMLRLRHFQTAKDAAGCRTSAEMLEVLPGTGAGFFYNAACSRAVTAAVVSATDRSPEGAKIAAAEADRAMDWLSKAVAAGYDSAVHMRQDNDLDVLREREDFRNLLAALEAKADDNIAAAREAVRREPDNIQRASTLSRLLHERAWELATDADPARRDPVKAVALAEELVARAPELPAHWDVLGIARYRAGDFDAALAALQKDPVAVKQRGGFFLAMAHWQRGNKDEAHRCYERAIQRMDKAAPNEASIRFRNEAAELLGVDKQ